MTIFDSLKYSISNPPTKEELEALPVDLYINWANHVMGANDSINELSPRTFLLYFNQLFNDVFRTNCVEDLRKRIAGWEGV